MREEEQKPVTEKEKRILDNIEDFIWNPMKFKEEEKE